MFNKAQNNTRVEKKETTIESLIGKKIVVEGNVIFQGGLRLDGQVIGNLITQAEQTATLVINEEAKVHGDVHVSYLILNGYVEGNIYVSELIEIQPKAHIKGDLHYVSLEMHQGAIIEGRLIHTPSIQKEQQEEIEQAKLKQVQAKQPSKEHTNNTPDSKDVKAIKTETNHDKKDTKPVDLNLNSALEESELGKNDLFQQQAKAIQAQQSINSFGFLQKD